MARNIAQVALLDEALRYYQAGNLKAAKSVYADVLKKDPDNAEALHGLGCLYDDMGNSSLAVKLLVRAVKANRMSSQYHYNLANVYLRQGKLGDASRHYREAIHLKPNYALAYNNLGLCLSQMGQRADAKANFQSAISYKSGYADPHNNLALELKKDGDLDGAEGACLAAIRIKPDFAEAYCVLGGVYLSMQRVVEAAEAYLQAVKLQPRNSKFHTNLGAALLRLGAHQDAIESFEQALRLDPQDAVIRSNRILASSYMTDDPKEIQLQTERWDHMHGLPLRGSVNRHRNVPDPERRLRIGYVSADFCNHAAVYWIEPLLVASQNRDLEIVCYNNSTRVDSITERLKPFADTWVDCVALSDEALATRIRQDAIDILVDLSSHTEGHRLLAFARQPAPIQVSWFGFPVSTGLKTMHYRFTDAVMDLPDKADEFYSEKLIRLDRFYAAFRPDPATPGVGVGPVVLNGSVTFASFNTLAKITSECLNLWAKILIKTPDSRLLLQAAGLDKPDLAERVNRVFAEQGIEPHRLLLRGWATMDDYLRLGEEVDIVLDSFPFNGGVTTCHALWMGLPVITLCGLSAASRVGASILTRMGLSEYVASDSNTYRKIASSLAQDRDRLALLRSSLRTRMEAAGMLDGDALASEVEAKYRIMWKTWCAGA